jgi:hypothetical protein
MKKLISLLLAAVLVLALCACGGGNDADTNAAPAFRVGFGRVNITPNPNTGLQMGGYDGQVSQGVLSYIYATCVAITDETDNTLLLYTLDITDMNKEASDALRTKLTESTGIPGENIIINSTHTHSGPDVTQTPEYNEWYVQRLFEAAREAMEDRKPGTMEIGRTQAAHSMNFVRHYILDENGKSCGHKAEPDRQLQVVKITREGGKDIVIVNFQGHPHREGGYRRLCGNLL